MGRAVLSYRELSQAAGAKKPSESRKANALRAMKAAWDRAEEIYIAQRGYFWQNKKSAGIVGGTSQKTRWRLWQRHWNAWSIPGGWLLSLPAFVVAMAFIIVGAKICKIRGKGPVASGLSWTHGMLWVCAQRPASGTFRGSTGRTGSSFLLHQEGALCSCKGSGV